MVPLEDFAFPKIPGVRIPTTMHRAYRVDYGSDFYTKGIVAFEPPKVGKAFPMLVPQVDADGNETAGIRLPMLAQPLGTFTGWNHRAPRLGAPELLSDMIGSYIPFARTKAEREKSGDPRPSVEERYGSREDYRKALMEAAEEVAGQGFLLKTDVERNVEAGMMQWDFVMDWQ